MSSHCVKHTFETSAGRCRTCDHDFCQRCLVYAFGPKKPPYCVACAISAAGVRTAAANSRVVRTPEPKLSRKELRAQRKAMKAQQAATAGAEPEPEPTGMMPPIGIPISSTH